jgi:hypothetical protein
VSRLAVVVAVAASASASVAVADDAPGELAPRANVVRVEHRPAGTAPTLGPATALVTIEYFFTPGQQQTRATFSRLTQLQASHPSRIRVVYRIVKRGRELLLPIAAAEAHDQGRFFELMQLLERYSTSLRRDAILDLARQIGMDTDRLQAAWEDGRHEAMLAANENRHKRLHGKPAPEALFNGVAAVRALGSLEPDTLEGMYLDAYDRAIAALDRGVPRASLGELFDREAFLAPQDQVLSPGPIDDPDPLEPLAPPAVLLASPLDRRGWPALGPADAPVVVTVLCNLRTVACRNQIALAQRVHDLYDGLVRLVWAPMFDPGAGDAAESTMFNDAALCAEELGAGWSWVEQAINVGYRRAGRPADADKEIDLVIAATELDGGAVARCLASAAGASARVVARVRKSGVKTGPSLVVGGRVYPGGLAPDYRMLQTVVEEELAPGVLEQLAPSWSPRAAR